MSSTKFNEVNTKGEKKLPDGILVQLINDFNEITLTDDNFEFPDLLGAAYEYLLKYFADIAGKKGGEFYTPECIDEILVAVIDPQPNDRLFEPCCGSGGLIVQSDKVVKQKAGAKCSKMTGGGDYVQFPYLDKRRSLILGGWPRSIWPFAA